jgi:FKBP-type peptidyl-prolyl cis-trans isomerase 2
MNDLAHWDVHGRVETLRTELAAWDSARQEWEPFKRQTSVRFRPDGQLAQIEDDFGSLITYIYSHAGQILETRHQINDGTVSRNIHSHDGARRLARIMVIDQSGNRSDSEIDRYDPSGRKNENSVSSESGRQRVLLSGYRRGAAEWFGASGAATMTTVYDEHDQAAEVLVHDATHRLLRRMTMTRDSAARVEKEEVVAGTTPVFPEIENNLKDASQEDRESLKAPLAVAFGTNNVLLTTTYAYDQKGRRVERIVRMGLLSEDRTTFRFDDHDNPIEEISSSHKEHARSIYKYDAEGNWTEREVWTILEPKPDFQRSNVERRQITYY